MFFLLPKVILVLLIVFGLLVGVRVWRQRHSPPRLPRHPLWARRQKTLRKEALIPAALLKGAERTWVVFVTSDCLSCVDLARRLRSARPDDQVTEVDSAAQPGLAETFLIRRHPTVLVANRYGQVESRLVGTRAVGNVTKVRSNRRAQVRKPA